MQFTLRHMFAYLTLACLLLGGYVYIGDGRGFLIFLAFTVAACCLHMLVYVLVKAKD